MKRPTYLELTIGLCISFIQSFGTKKIITTPRKIDKYILEKNINKTNQFKFYSLGIYSNKEKKVFIKTWKGSIKNFNYYSLMNEYVINSIINEKLMKLNRTNKIKVKLPEIIDVIHDKNSLSLVFELIDGKTLNKFSFDVQKKALIRIFQTLNIFSQQLTIEEKKQMPIRTEIFYILTLPLFLILAIVSNKKDIGIFIRAFIRALREYKLLTNGSFYLAHRDLDLDNIILKNSCIYVIDYGSMVLTVPNYDITYISLDPKLNRHSEVIINKLKQSPDLFLKQYIALQHSKSYGNPKHFDNYFLKSLYLL